MHENMVMIIYVD